MNSWKCTHTWINGISCVMYFDEPRGLHQILLCDFMKECCVTSWKSVLWLHERMLYDFLWKFRSSNHCRTITPWKILLWFHERIFYDPHESTFHDFMKYFISWPHESIFHDFMKYFMTSWNISWHNDMNLCFHEIFHFMT